MAADGLAHADTGGLRQVAGGLDPVPAEVARAAAVSVHTTAQDCPEPMPGCAAFIAAVGRVTDRVAAFCAEAEDGIRDYGSVALGGAAEYETRDGNGRALFTGMTAEDY